MAKAKKKTPAKSARSTTRRSPEPTRIVIEIVIRNEMAAAQPAAKAFIPEAAIAEASFAEAAAAPNFSYSFSRQGATILKLVVERFSQDMPPDSGSFFSQIMDPNPTKKVVLRILARQDQPGGSASFSMKFNGKDVFASPKDLVFKQGKAAINEFVNLPK